MNPIDAPLPLVLLVIILATLVAEEVIKMLSRGRE